MSAIKQGEQSGRMTWARAMVLAACWSFGIVLTTTLIASEIDLDGRHPDYEWFLGLIAPVSVVTGIIAHCFHRTPRVSGLIFPLVIVFALVFLAVFLILDISRIGA